MINLYVLFLLLQLISSEIAIPFITIKGNITTETPSTFTYFYFQNKIETIFKIGTPYQEIPLRIKYLAKPLSVNSVQMGTYQIKRFNESNSSSYIPLHDNPLYYGENDFTQAIKSKEVFNINNNNNDLILKNLSFFLGVIDNKYYKNSGVLGLNIAQMDWRANGMGFIQQLKERNITKRYNFFIKYNEDSDDGLLIIDGLPHEIYPEKYDKKNYRDFYAQIVSSSMGLQINEANYGETLVDCEFNAELAVEDNFIRGTEELRDFLMDNFFKVKITRKICSQSYFTYIDSDNLEFFYCNKKLNLSEFKNISLSVMNSELKIELSYNDLFYEFKDNYYFLIYFPTKFYSYLNFRLGKMIFKKYMLTFDHDTKRIGYYIKANDTSDKNGNEEENNNEETNDEEKTIKKNKKKNNLFNVLPWIIIGALVIIVLLLGLYIIYSKLCKNRTKRANELQDDNYAYEGINEY